MAYGEPLLNGNSIPTSWRIFKILFGAGSLRIFIGSLLGLRLERNSQQVFRGVSGVVSEACYSVW